MQTAFYLILHFVFLTILLIYGIPLRQSLREEEDTAVAVKNLIGFSIGLSGVITMWVFFIWHLIQYFFGR